MLLASLILHTQDHDSTAHDKIDINGLDAPIFFKKAKIAPALYFSIQIISQTVLSSHMLSNSSLA
jgi:hypothetical protein